MKKLSVILFLLCVLLPLNACNNEPSVNIDYPGQGNDKNNDDMETKTINIQAASTILTCRLENNSSANALLELLESGPVTIEMNDYANMEKVGELPVSLPQNNRQLHTVPGDVILYLGRYFVIYYGNNNYSLTKLGIIEGNYSSSDLKKILGNGDVTVVISMKK